MFNGIKIKQDCHVRYLGFAVLIGVILKKNNVSVLDP